MILGMTFSAPVSTRTLGLPRGTTFDGSEALRTAGTFTRGSDGMIVVGPSLTSTNASDEVNAAGATVVHGSRCRSVAKAMGSMARGWAMTASIGLRRPIIALGCP